MAEYLLNSALWSIGGLAVGFWLGRLTRDVREIKEKVTRGDDD